MWVERTKLREWTLGHRDPQTKDKGSSAKLRLREKAQTKAEKTDTLLAC